MRGSKAVLKLLEGQGADVIFGYPGANTLPIYDDLLDSSIHHVLVRHEQGAAHMADGYARSTGRPGICMSTSGPGATNLVTGVATAYADSSPMMVITGQVSTQMLGENAFQEADIFSLMMPITKHSFRVLDPNRIPEAIKKGWGIATTGRMGPVHIDLPVDVLWKQIADEALYEEFHAPCPVEDMSRVLEAVKLLRDAERPMMLVGGGAIWSHAGEEVRKLAEMLMAPVATTMMGKGIIPEDHPLAMGMLGMHGREVARRAYESCDVMLVVGSRFSDRSTGLPTDLPESTKIIHIDIDPMEAGKNKRTKVRIVGDARKALQLLIKGLSRAKAGSEWCKRMVHLRQICDCEMDIDEMPIKPQKVMLELRKALSDDAYVCTEVGQNQMWAAHFLRMRTPGHFISSGGMGTMGFGFPASLGVKYAHRDKQVVDIAGDGSLQMVSKEFATAMSEDLPVVICLLNNSWLGMVRQWQKLLNDGRYSGTNLERNPDFVKLARSYGADALRVERPSELAEAFEKALRSDVPFLLDIVVDVEEDILPMLPGGRSSKEVIHGKRCRFGRPHEKLLDKDITMEIAGA
ncbi:MAG: biosynthetic-type acetolactate synthase large subunit [Methanomassiliicoccales archaeon]|nr:MAG: biosynthetic-type acetolactate synthase large subunit [Methanomassiliicoccales archaeon]